MITTTPLRGFGTLALASLLTLSSPLLSGAQETEPVADRIPAVFQAASFPVSIRSIMRGQELIGGAPSGARWSDDSEWVYFSWQPADGSERAQYRVPASGGTPEEVSDEDLDAATFDLATGDLTDDRRYRAGTMEGDVYLYDRSSGDVRWLTRTAVNETSAVFSADGSAVLFERGGDVFSVDRASGLVQQITAAGGGGGRGGGRGAAGAGGDDPQEEFLRQQQQELFEYLRSGGGGRGGRGGGGGGGSDPDLPVTVAPPPGTQLGGLDPAPSGLAVALRASRPGGAETESTMVPRWITASGYTEPINTRTKVGDVGGGTSQVGLLDVTDGDVTWVDFDGALPSLTNRLGEQPVFANPSFQGWNDAGSHGLVSATSADYEYRILASLDGATAELRVLDILHDSAWVAGPCGGCAGWIPDTDRAWFVSEESGYAQLYAIDADGTDRAALTQGEWEVQQVRIPESRDHFLLTTNEESPFDSNLYRMEFDGSDRVRITAGTGDFQTTVSPNGERIAVIHSRADQPPELYLMDNEPGAAMERITTTPSEEWRSFEWLEPEIIRFTASDGVEVPARIYRPSDVGATPHGGAVLFVHGAGYLQNVHNKWSTYFREYMFHHLLAGAGYTVLDIDYRGSAGYGRDWRTAIYRWMGGRDLQDQVDGARYLVENEGIDADRIGLYGGSYGGFITLMAMFTEPGVFASGAGLRSVTDWAHYNHGYTARILNEPQEDPEAYERSSPIYFAEGLEGELLILHGMVDTNVHFSDVVRLAQRLIELGKENWEFAVYPVEGHGFTIPSSWTDEYRRIFELFERTLR